MKYQSTISYKCSNLVAPLVGAWIEIPKAIRAVQEVSVAPLVGAWIEMSGTETKCPYFLSRSPRGSVD